MITEQAIKERAEFYLMISYEKANGVNCHGYTPMKTDAPDYQKAKKRALRLTKCFFTLEVHDYIKENF